MHAHKIKVTISEDHELSVKLPQDFPAGPAEVIVLAEPSTSRRIVRLSGALAPDATEEIPGDPIADALEELRRERAERFDRKWPDREELG